MEKSQHTNEQIIKVISFILSRLDTLEVEQSRHKEMFFKVRKNLTDANDLINQILDVLEVENPELFEKTVQSFKNGYMKDLIETELSEEQNEVLIEAIDLIDEKIIELES